MRDPFRQSLEEWDGSHPDRWDPGEGDMIVGKLTRYDGPISTEYGQAHVAVIRDEKDGKEKAVWLLETVLLNEFKNLAPDPGERVGIKYVGLQEPRDHGRPYKKFIVRVERDEKTAHNPFRGHQADPPPPDARVADQSLTERVDQMYGHAPGPTASTEESARMAMGADTDELKNQWDNLVRKYRVEDWQLEALAQGHPDLEDYPEKWGHHDYECALAVVRKHGAPIFMRTAKKLAKTEPPDDEQLATVVELSQAHADAKLKLRVSEAIESNWHDAIVWAHQLLNTVSPAPSEPSLDEPDDDLPF